MMRAVASLALVIALAFSGFAVAQSPQPLDSLRQMAESGDAEAQYQLALRHDRGDGTPQNFSAAAPWLERAAAQDHRAAQNLLGKYYHAGLGVAGDQALAVQWLRRAAQDRSADHLYDLARALDLPRDGDADHAAAADFYRQAAEAGHTEAAVSLGVLYQAGSGVPQDYGEARRLYETAAEHGNVRAINNLGLLYVRGHGALQDYDRAAALFAQAAEAGLSEAVRNLGVMYENGFGVRQDDAIAAELYRRAGGLKRPQSAAELAFFLDPRLIPDLTAESPQTQIDTLRRSAAAGDPVAQHLVALAALQGQAPAGTPRDAAAWLKKAALRGHGPSMANLGLMYFKGVGVPQDYVLGYKWMSLAASTASAEAESMLAILLPQLTPAQLAEAQSRAEAEWARITQ